MDMIYAVNQKEKHQDVNKINVRLRRLFSFIQILLRALFYILQTNSMIQVNFSKTLMRDLQINSIQSTCNFVSKMFIRKHTVGCCTCSFNLVDFQFCGFPIALFKTFY